MLISGIAPPDLGLHGTPRPTGLRVVALDAADAAWTMTAEGADL
jgi:hypothetical protein